jgi:poly-gamma-glutamate synthesis protein (capsule biosynthesis protein)
MTRVAAVGDLMLGDSSITVGFGVHGRYPGMELARVFTALAPRLAAADLAIGNLECPLTPDGVGTSRWKRDQMRGDEAYARVLRNAGFTAISVGNNHAMQHGDDGFARTVSALRDAGLLVLGLRGTAPWLSAPVEFRGPGGQSVGILAYSWRPRQYGEGTTPYADVEPAAVLADVARAKAAFDSVIVSLHWGEEFVDRPSLDEMQFAHDLAARGADLVLGHHPHVARPVEAHGNAVIAYSLGNAVSDMLWMDELRNGLLIETELTPSASSTRLTGLRTDDNYTIRIGETAAVQPTVAALETTAYERASSAGLSAQRAASYRYLGRKLLRYHPAVLVSLVGTTAKNKVHALMKRPARETG